MKTWATGKAEFATRVWRKIAQRPLRHRVTPAEELMASVEGASDLQECRDRLTEWLLSTRGLAIARDGERAILEGTPLTGAQRRLIRAVESFGYRVRIQ